MIDFTLNQSEIVEEFCENIDRPELNCDGHCYLNKELQSIDEKMLLTESSSNDKSGKNQFNTDWYSEVNPMSIVFQSCSVLEDSPVEKNLLSEIFKSKVFEPPQV